MKKGLLFIVIFALLGFTVAPVFAQAEVNATSAPGVWVSSINIQNPSDTEANVVLDFYDANGTKVFTFNVSPPIPAKGSRSLYVPADVAGLASGQFSVVASSNVDINVVVNSSSTAPYTAGAYTGVKSGETGTVLYFPGLYNNYYGFYSELVLQNTGDTTANVSIQFYDQRTGAAVGTLVTGTIPLGSSKTFVLSSISGLPSGNANGLFSAKVTSTNGMMLAGVANIWTAAVHGEFAEYSAFIQGDTSIYVPALYKAYYDFVSSLTIQNLGTASTNVTITYSNGTVDSATIAANQAIELYQPNNPSLPSGNANGVFSAKVTSSGEPIVALVNIEDKNKGSLASYNGLVGPTNTVLCPVVLKDYYYWFSAETVQNVGTAPTNITITYANGMTRVYNNVPPNGTVNIIELANAGSPLPVTSSLAATITSSGQPLVAVVQENSNTRYSENPGDYLLSYSCANK